jgi:chorismate-pyruvate lyase
MCPAPLAIEHKAGERRFLDRVGINSCTDVAFYGRDRCMNRGVSKVLAGAAAGLWLLLAAAARAGDVAVANGSSAWPDTPGTRLEALALLQTLNADLLSNDSATLTLDRWCESHRMATPAKIVAERVRDQDKDPTDEVRKLLGVAAGEPVRYRHVRLHCGTHVFSEADNWYVPARLTADMNAVLDTSDTPFGRAVQALHFHRHTLSAQLLWSPLPPGWEMQSTLGTVRKGALPIPPETIQHRAVLSLPDGRPFSVVVETYTNEILSFPRPPRP